MTDYGGLNFDYLIKKHEHTDIYEDENDTNNYQRRLMKDFRPDDNSALASDAPRRNSWYSKSTIDFKTSGNENRSGLLPDAPDLFLWDNTPDPRGTQDAPDMMRMADMIRGRSKDYQFSFNNDDDRSVPSQGINPQRMDELKRATFYSAKDRMKIFSTSLDGRPTGQMTVGGDMSLVNNMARMEKANIYDEGDIQDGEVHAGKTTTLSDLTAVGYYSVPDNRFQVAKYGQIISGRSLDKQFKSGRFGVDDHKLRVFGDINIPKSLALAMKQSVKDQIAYDHKFGISKDTRSYKNNPAREKQLRDSMYDAKIPVHMEKILSVITVNKPGGKQNKSTLQDKSIKQIAEAVASMSKSGDHSDIRKVLDQQDQNHKVKESMAVQSYKSKAQTIRNNNLENPEEYTGESKNTIFGKNKNNNDRHHARNADEDTGFDEFGDNIRHIAPLGKKYMAKHQDTEDDQFGREFK